MEHRKFNAISQALASGTSRRVALKGALAAALGRKVEASAAPRHATVDNSEARVDWVAAYGDILEATGSRGYVPRDGLNAFFQTSELVTATGLSPEDAAEFDRRSWIFSLYGQLVVPNANNPSGTGTDAINVFRFDTFETSGDAKSYLKMTRGAWERNDIVLIPSEENGVSGLNIYTLTTPYQSNPDVQSHYVNGSMLVNTTTVFTYLAIGYDIEIDSADIVDVMSAVKKRTRALTNAPIAQFFAYPEVVPHVQLFVPQANGIFFPAEGATNEQIDSQSEFAQDAMYQYTGQFQFNGTGTGNPYFSYQTGSVFETPDQATNYFNFFPDYLAKSDTEATNVVRIFNLVDPPDGLPDGTQFARDTFVINVGGGTLLGGAEVVGLFDNTVASSAIFSLTPIDPNLSDPTVFSESPLGQSIHGQLDTLITPFPTDDSMIPNPYSARFGTRFDNSFLSSEL